MKANNTNKRQTALGEFINNENWISHNNKVSEEEYYRTSERKKWMLNDDKGKIELLDNDDKIYCTSRDYKWDIVIHYQPPQVIKTISAATKIAERFIRRWSGSLNHSFYVIEKNGGSKTYHIHFLLDGKAECREMIDNWGDRLNKKFSGKSFDPVMIQDYDMDDDENTMKYYLVKAIANEENYQNSYVVEDDVAWDLSDHRGEIRGNKLDIGVVVTSRNRVIDEKITKLFPLLKEKHFYSLQITFDNDLKFENGYEQVTNGITNLRKSGQSVGGQSNREFFKQFDAGLYWSDLILGDYSCRWGYSLNFILFADEIENRGLNDEIRYRAGKAFNVEDKYLSVDFIHYGRVDDLALTLEWIDNLSKVRLETLDCGNALGNTALLFTNDLIDAKGYSHQPFGWFYGSQHLAKLKQQGKELGKDFQDYFS